MNGQRQEFVEVEKVGVGDHWHMEDECELVLGRVVDVRDLDLELRSEAKVTKGTRFFFLATAVTCSMMPSNTS